jgi:hypothetical protein
MHAIIGPTRRARVDFANTELGKDDVMGKEKNRGGKEIRKPKKEVPKKIAAAPSTKGNPTQK